MRRLAPIFLLAGALALALGLPFLFAQPAPFNYPPAGSSGGLTALNQNQFDSSSTNIAAGALQTNGVFYSSGTTNRPLRVFGTNGTSEVYVDKDATIQTPTGSASALAINFNGVGFYNSGGNLRASAQMMYPVGGWIQSADATEGLGTFGTTAGLGLASSKNITWSSGVTWYSSQDTAITRNAANTLEFHSGTAGIANRGTLLAAKYTGRGGTSTNTFNAAGPIYSSITAVGNVGAGEDDLISQSVSANVLASNGDRIRITAPVVFANNAELKQVKAYWNGTAFWQSGSASFVSSAVIEVTITRTGAATQNIITRVVSPEATIMTAASDFDTGSATLSGAVTFKLTGEAVNNDDIIQKELLIEYLPAP